MTSQTLQMTVMNHKIENISEKHCGNDIQTWHQSFTSDEAQSKTHYKDVAMQHSRSQPFSAVNQISMILNR